MDAKILTLWQSLICYLFKLVMLVVTASVFTKVVVMIAVWAVR